MQALMDIRTKLPPQLYKQIIMRIAVAQNKRTIAVQAEDSQKKKDELTKVLHILT